MFRRFSSCREESQSQSDVREIQQEVCYKFLFCTETQMCCTPCKRQYFLLLTSKMNTMIMQEMIFPCTLPSFHTLFSVRSQHSQIIHMVEFYGKKYNMKHSKFSTGELATLVFGHNESFRYFFDRTCEHPKLHYQANLTRVQCYDFQAAESFSQRY